jgi:hypothetical protein
LSGAVLAYVGLGPGQEFIPYFLGLLALMLTALGAVLRWPFSVLARLLSRSRHSGAGETNGPTTPPAPEPAGEGRDPAP